MTARRWLGILLLGLATLTTVVVAMGYRGPRAASEASAQEPSGVKTAGGPGREAAAKPAGPAQGARFVFNFRNAPWSQVLERFSQYAELPLVMEAAPPGTFSFSDEKPYTVTEALDLVNRVLLAKSFLLVRTRDLLVLVPTDKPVPSSLVPVVEVDELAKRADNELVTVSIPLAVASPESAVPGIRTLLSSFGQTVPLPQVKRLLVTDLVTNLRKIHQLLVELDKAAKPPSPPAAPPTKTEKVIPLKHVEATAIVPALQKVFADAAVLAAVDAKNLVAQATPEVHARLAQLIEAIDKPPALDPPTVDAIYKLKHLSAAGFYSSLQTLFPADSRKARFSYDAANNAVIATAPGAVHEAVRTLIEQLDRPSSDAPIEKTYAAKHVPIEPLLSTLQTLYADGQTRLATDALKQKIIVTAPPERHAKIAAMVEQLDQPLDPKSAPAERVYKLKHASAAAVSSMIQTLYPPNVTSARFSADSTNNLLVAVATEDMQSKVRKLLEEIDHPAPSTVEERVYVPQHIPTAPLVATLQSLYAASGSTRITADPSGKSILVSAPPEQHKKIEAMLAQLDKPEDPKLAPVSRVYKLAHASAGAVAGSLQTLFPTATTQAAISYDATNNLLMVAATETLQAKVQKLLEEIDRPGATTAEERVYEPKHLAAAALVSTLQSLYASAPSTRITADPSGKSILVSAPPEQQKKIEAMIAQLDKPEDPKAAPVTHVYKLAHASAGSVAGSLQTLFPTATTRATISYDATNNLLIVAATETLQAKVQKLLEEIDRPGAATAEERVYQPKHLEPAALVSTLQNLYAAAPSTRITADPSGKSILVSAPPEQQKKIEAMLAQLDKPEDPKLGLISRAYKLEYASASSLVSPLQTLFPAATTRATISYDSSNNAIVATAPQAVHDRIAELVKQMDQPALAARRIDKVYALKRADPRAVLSSLQSLYSGQGSFVADPTNRAVVASAPEPIQSKIASVIEQLDKAPSSPAVAHRVYRLRFATPESLATALQSVYQDRPEVRVLSDSANRSLVVVAPEEVQAAVAAMVQEADQLNQGAELVERVYRPKHVSAASLLSTLTNLYGVADNVARSQQPPGRFTLDAATQAVVAVATEPLHVRIQATVNLLDRPADPTTRAVVKIYPLRNVTRDTVSAALRAAYAQQAHVQVLAGADPDAIVVLAPEPEQAQIAKLIADADQPAAAGDKRTAEVIPLAEVDPFTAVSTIRSMFSTLPGAQMPFVQGESDPDRLVIRATPDQAIEIRRLLVQLGEAPSLLQAGGERARTVRSLRVERGSPATLAAAIEKLWPRLRRNPLRVVTPSELVPSLREAPRPAPPSKPAQGPPGRQAKEGEPPPADARLPGEPNKPVVLTATPTKLIATSDDPDALALVERLARSLTEIPTEEQGEFTVFYLKHADATSVAQTLNSAFNGPEQPGAGQALSRRLRPDRVRVVANPDSNALLVRASPTDLVTIEQMIDSLDASDVALDLKGAHLVPLKQASADEVAQILREVYRDYIVPGSTGPGGTRGFTARRPRGAGGPPTHVSIGVDRRSNSVVIAAPDALFAQMQTLIQALEAAAGDSGGRYRVVPLHSADSLDVRDALEILLQRGRPVSTPGGAAGGTRRERKPSQPRRPTRSGPSSALPQEPGKAVGQNGAVHAAHTSVATIRVKSGSIEVSDRDGQAGRRELDEIPTLLPTPPRQPGAQGPVMLAQHAAPAEEKPTPAQLTDQARVDALPDLNVLLLSGTDRDLEILAEIIQQIERLAEDGRLAFRVVPLQHVKAVRLAALVDDLYSALVNARGSVARAAQETRVIPLAKPNAILLAAPRNELGQLVTLITDLDQPVPAETQFRVFRLAHARAAELVQVVRQFFAGRNADGELAAEVVVTADPRSNTLVVLAGPRDMAEVERLLADLDTQTTANVNQIQVFSLENTLATELATVLDQAIRGTPTPTGTAPTVGGTMLRLLRPDQEQQRVVESGILENVRVTANPRSNTLVVSAPPKTMSLIAELIRQLDVPPTAAAEIKVFTLKNSDATRMGQMLQTLFSQARGPGEVTVVGAVQGQAPGQQAAGSPMVGLTFSIDERTNSLLVSGSRAQLDLVEAIIVRLDGSDVQERKSAVYRLKNATATAVATALGDFLQRQLLRQLQQAGVTAPTQLLERDVVVVPESVTNSLLISAVPRVYPDVLKLIEQLDEAPPQVVIQVLIAEVTLTENEEFGLELGIQDSVLFRRGIFPGTATLGAPFTPVGVAVDTTTPPGLPGFNFNNLPLGNNPTAHPSAVGAQGLSHFALGRVGSDGFGGLVLSASSESLSVLLRALKAQGRVNVLSRPQIMTVDNQEAFIQVGQKVPIITNSVITSSGSVINPVNFQDVGIILHVTPKVNPDGVVIMRVDPEISALSQSNVEISTGVFAPIIDTTRAETTVSAQNGQTVVIGGLITSTRMQEHRKVPLLGDIPILQWAFRYDQKSCRKRELLILLTPHVVRTAEEAEQIKRMEAERMDWCLKEVESIGGPIDSLPLQTPLQSLDSVPPSESAPPPNGPAPEPSGAFSPPTPSPIGVLPPLGLRPIGATPAPPVTSATGLAPAQGLRPTWPTMTVPTAAPTLEPVPAQHVAPGAPPASEPVPNKRRKLWWPFTRSGS